MMFAFTEEHEELRRTVRKFLENHATEQKVRGLMQSERGYDPEVWAQMAGQMALPGLIVPEQYGGAGLGYVELTVVMEEMGRTLFCAPYLSCAVLAVNALMCAGGEAVRAELLPEIVAGKKLVTVAVAEEGGSWEAGDATATATPADGAWSITGHKLYVLDGHVADALLVVAKAPDGVGLFRVDGEADGVLRSLLPTLDLTRKLARVELSNAPAMRVDAGGQVAAALDRALALTVIALTAEQVGGARRCLEMSTEYARTRLQFGRPIGSFQAIKHKCADMLVEVEFARSAAYNAGFTAAEPGCDDAEIFEAAHLAKSYCSDAYFHAAAETIQIHGGMGFTWEHPAHLYFKRAKSSAMLFGDAMQHREKLAARVGI